MPLFGKGDVAAAMPKWVGALLKKKSTPAVVASMFGNTTPGTTGVFGVNAAEAQANPGIAHAGIIARTTGTGGRAGRVQTEVLVAGGTFGITDAADDAAIPDALAKIPATQPINRTTSAGAATTFTAAPTVKPSGVALTYLWETAAPAANSPFGIVPAGAPYSGHTTATLAISSTAGIPAGTKFRLKVTPVGGPTAISRAATLN